MAPHSTAQSTDEVKFNILLGTYTSAAREYPITFPVSLEPREDRFIFVKRRKDQ